MTLLANPNNTAGIADDRFNKGERSSRRDTASTVGMEDMESLEFDVSDVTTTSSNEDGIPVADEGELDLLIALISKDVAEKLKRSTEGGTESQRMSPDTDRVAELITASVGRLANTSCTTLRSPQRRSKTDLDVSAHSYCSTSSNNSASDWCSDVLDVSNHSENYNALQGLAKPMMHSTGRSDFDYSEHSEASEEFRIARPIKSPVKKCRSSTGKGPATRGGTMPSSIPMTGSGSSKVKFQSITVREYNIILGDNPASKLGGPSLSLGWDYTELPAMKVRDFEQLRKGKRSKGQDLLLSRKTREKMFRRLGYSDSDIAAAVRQVNKVQFQRQQTSSNIAADDMKQAITGRVKNLFFRKGKK